MKRFFLPVFAILAVLSVIAALDRLPSLRWDLSRESLGRLKPETVQKLSHLSDKVVVTYYSSDRSRLPADLRELPQEVNWILSQMSRASGGKLTLEHVDPTEDAALSTKLGYEHISPFNVKSIHLDDYSVSRVWSGMIVRYKGQERATPVILREHVPGLEAKILQDIRDIESPRRAAVALSIPWPDKGLRGTIASGAQLLEFHFGRDPVPEAADILFLVQPRFTPESARALKNAIDAGKSVFLLASPIRLAYRGSRETPEVAIGAEIANLPAFLDDLGVSIPNELALDVNHVGSNPSTVVIPPFGFDLSRFRAKMVGEVIVPVGGAIRTDPGRMKAAGWSSDVLMHSTALAWTRPAPQKEISWDAFCRPAGGPWERRMLNFGVMLRHEDPWKGKVFLFSSQYLFDDVALSLSRANANFLRNLLQSFTTTEYRPGPRTDARKAPRLPPLQAGERLFWRVIGAGFVPIILLFLLYRRYLTTDSLPAAAGNDGGKRHDKKSRHPLRSLAGDPSWAPVAVFLLIALWPRYASPSWDVTREQVHRLDSESVSLFRSLPQAVTLRYLSSPEDEMPQAGKRARAVIRDTLRRMERASHGRLSVQEMRVSGEKGRDPQIRSALAASGITSFTMETIEQDSYRKKAIYSAITLESGGRQVTLSPLQLGTESKTEFLVDSALLRLLGAKPSRVTLIAEPPRLTPSEALEYAQWMQPVPQAADTYSQLRELLTLYGYDIQTLSPRDVPRQTMQLPVAVQESTETLPLAGAQQPDIWKLLHRYGYDAKSISPDQEQGIRSRLLLYMQPFTLDDRLKTEIDRHLSQGGNAIVAAQHFNIQERKYRGRAFEAVYWPQPQFSRINEWIEAYGISLVREVLMDRSRKQALMDTQLRLGAVLKENRKEPAALPFMIHATPENFNKDSLITRILGDQLFIAGNRFVRTEKFPSSLQWKPLITASPQAWGFAWKSGFLSEPDFKEGTPLAEPAALAVEVDGQFPLTQKPGMLGEKPARLILIGCSEIFKNGRLLDARYRAADLLMNAVVNMTYGEALTRIHARAVPSPQGFGYLAPRQKTIFRLIIFGIPLLLALCVWTWRLRRLKHQKRI